MTNTGDIGDRYGRRYSRVRGYRMGGIVGGGDVIQ